MAKAVRTSIAVAVIVIVLTGTAGFVLGSRSAGAVVHSGVASPAQGAISAVADGRTYNVPLDVPWTDAHGVFHEAGRPDRLAAGVNADVPITFASVDVSADGNGWHQVVWVDCRSL
jgi:hypothetical protein